jgi:hypothetical protein
VLKQAETLIRAARRKVFCEAITGQWAGIKGTVCPDAATLARRVDLLLMFGGDGTMLRLARGDRWFAHADSGSEHWQPWFFDGGFLG